MTPEVRRGGPHAISADDARGSVPAIVAAIDAIFADLEDGVLAEARINEHSRPRRPPVTLAHASGRRVCPSDLASIVFPFGGGHVVHAEVDLADSDGALGVIPLALWRSDDAPEGWALDARMFARDLLALVALRSATRALPDTAGLTHRIIAGEVAVTQWTEGDRPMTCVQRVAEPEVARCFSDLPTGSPAIGMGLGPIALGWRPGSCFSIPWPNGTIERVPCRDFPAEGEPDASVHEIDAPAALRRWGDVALAAVGADIALLGSSDWRSLCVRSGTPMCTLPFRSTEGQAITCSSVTAPLEGNGSGWLAARCTRQEEPGAEMEAGDSLLIVLERSASGLRLHGFLPAGGFSSERTEHDPDARRTVWETDFVEYPDVAIDARGCVTLGPPRSGHRSSERSRIIPRPAPEPAPDRLDGRLPFDLYHPPDTQGHWASAPDGGFSRVERCEP